MRQNYYTKLYIKLKLLLTTITEFQMVSAEARSERVSTPPSKEIIQVDF